MENDPVNIPAAPAQAADLSPEARLNALAEKLSLQLEAAARQDSARREALDTREADLNRREMQAKAREALEKHGLPGDLADCLSFENEQAMETAVAVLENVFRAAVQQGVEERLLTDAPKAGAAVPLSQLSDEEYYAAVCRND